MADRPSAERAAAGRADPSGFRDHARAPDAAGGRDAVRETYRANHERQTLDLVLDKQREFLPPRRLEAGVWEVLERLDELVDESDPDLGLSQLEHALQTAEALRAAGRPRWLVLTGLIHDLGKVLCLFGEPQWAVVGDTFPVGCAFSDAVVYPELFARNPDRDHPERASRCGIYREGCGLRAVHMSWGHDEYMYHVVREHLPLEALYVIRYHSFWAWHDRGAYGHLLDATDRQMLAHVRAFARFDLYSKSPEPTEVARLRPFYERLVAEFLPPKLMW